ncbi:MmpS family transport accessory protein [Micromonospora vulcania]|uniref:MmpS family transport accessory protein n=1 Tax=Micromonospora vulcania TaxID=1441873 RepID=A0ABW1H063_9ACTN
MTSPPAAAGPHPTGWSPPGYPPPYVVPGNPPVGGGPSTGKVVGIVVAVVAVLTLLLCGGLCGAPLLFAWFTSETSPMEPYEDDPQGDDGGWPGPSIESAAPTPSSLPTPSKKPITRPTSGPAPVTVVYEVTGQGQADIAYYDAESDLMHVDNATLPWRTTIRTNGKSRVMVEATWPELEYTGPLDCAITVTGTGRPSIDKSRGYWMTTCEVT